MLHVLCTYIVFLCKQLSNFSLYVSIPVRPPLCFCPRSPPFSLPFIFRHSPCFLLPSPFSIASFSIVSFSLVPPSFSSPV